MSDAEDLARDRDRAQALLEEWVASDALRRHCRSVEIALRAYAAELGEDADAWGCVGLLHDFDWERHPSLERHPQDGEPVLAALGYPEWFRRAILSHAEHVHLPRETALERHLFACDELAGFIHACALMRPDRLEGMEPRSVRKKLKDKRFAANVSREDITAGAEGIGRDLDDHIAFVIAALAPHAAELGLTA
ncbi:MAG: HD domain-containing protein [Thermoleophilia bacterium]|nr:HD domain-containing protein [Thermoleophilia bacterium]